MDEQGVERDAVQIGERGGMTKLRLRVGLPSVDAGKVDADSLGGAGPVEAGLQAGLLGSGSTPTSHVCDDTRNVASVSSGNFAAMREHAPDVFYDRFDQLVSEAAARGVSLPKIAKAIGINQSNLYRWQDRETGPSGMYLAAFADYFGVSMDWIWGRTDARSSASSPGADGADHPVDELHPDRPDDQSAPNSAAG